LADHVQPFFLVLTLPYLFFPRTETLLILESAIIALGAVPLFAIARRRLHSPWWALAFAVIYLLMPAVETGSASDLHGLCFLPPLLLAAFDAAQRGKIGQWWLWMALAAGTREDVALFAGWAMLWLAPKEHRRQAFIMFVVGVLYSLLCFLVIIPHFGGGGTPYLTRFLPAGTELTTAGIWSVISQGRFWLRNAQAFIAYNVRLGLPLLFLYWLHWPALLAAAPLLVLNGFSWFPVVLYPNLSHYSAPLVPWICVGAVEGFAHVTRWLAEQRPNLNWRGLVGEALLVSTMATHVMSGYTPLALDFVWPRVGPRARARDALLAQIPERSIISAESHLGSHLARTKTMRFFPDLRDAEWIAMDFWTGHYFYLTAEERWREIAQDPTWETVTAGEGLLLLRRGDGPPKDIVEAFQPQVDDRVSPLQARFGDADCGVLLKGLDIAKRAGGHTIVCTIWQPLGRGMCLPQIATVGNNYRDLDGVRFYPDLFAQQREVQECTQFIDQDWRGSSVRFRVQNAAGTSLPLTLLDTGSLEERVGAEGPVLVVQRR
jgi:uncharacterized membrane protein